MMTYHQLLRELNRSRFSISSSLLHRSVCSLHLVFRGRLGRLAGEREMLEKDWKVGARIDWRIEFRVRL